MQLFPPLAVLSIFLSLQISPIHDINIYFRVLGAFIVISHNVDRCREKSYASEFQHIY